MTNEAEYRVLQDDILLTLTDPADPTDHTNIHDPSDSTDTSTIITTATTALLIADIAYDEV